MFALVSDISIGDFISVKPLEVKIQKSIFRYVDTAQITLPTTARIIQSGEVASATSETAKQFTEGDKVLIKLGYNGILRQEFEGFICRVNLGSPVVLECEGYSYQLRKKALSGTVKKIQLRDLLEKITNGTDIVLDDHIPGFVIEKHILEGKNGADILNELRRLTGETLKFFFIGQKLYAGFQFLNYRDDVKYRLGWNVINDKDLKLREAKHQNIIVNIIGENTDGTTTKVTSGTEGVVKTITTHGIREKTSLQQYADAVRKKYSYDGYEGRITAFGQPFCEPGFRVILIDDKFEERSGHYIANSTEVSYSLNGFRRVISIGEKLN